MMLYRSPHAIANHIRMMRSQRVCAWLVVEGSNDRQFFLEYIDPDNCSIQIAQGKENVLEVLRILNTDQFNGVLGIVDADFDRIDQHTRRVRNLVSPEFHDLDVLLIRSDALNSVLREYGSENKLKQLSKDPLQSLSEATFPIAALRIYSKRKNLRLKFQGLDFGDFVDRTTLRMNSNELVRRVMVNSQNHFAAVPQAVALLQEIEQQGYPDHEMCSGKDLLETLSIALKKKFGSVTNHTWITADQLRKYLRMSFNESMFQSTELYGAVRHWERRVGVFTILK